MFVITADQIGSRTDRDRAGEMIAALDSEFGPAFLLPPDQTAGDEIQLLLRDAGMTLAVLLALHRDGHWSIGLGIGDANAPLFTLEQRGHGVVTYDTRGNGDGQVVNTMAGDHQNRVTDYTAIVLRNREGKPGGGKGPLLSAERSLTLGTANDQVVFPAYRMVAFGEYTEDGTASALKARDYKDATDLTIGQIGIPRRLTPTECERLMGWEDGWTAHGIDERGREYALSDTPRYKLCGNGIASPVVQWIGMRLKMVLDSIAATR